MSSRIGGWSAVGALSRKAPEPTEKGAAKFGKPELSKLKLKEASDVVALPGGQFLVVGDRTDKVGLIGKDGKLKELDLPGLKNGSSQLEGVAFDPVRNHLMVAREESGEILRYEWNPEKSAAPKLEKTFKLNLDGPSNKGIEGLAYLSGQQSPTGRPHLVAAKEGSPREILLLADGGSSKGLKVKLEDQVKDVCKDFSAVAVDPKTGHLFISSDESSTVAQVRLKKKGNDVVGELVQSFPLRDKKDKSLERVEGLTFDGKGNLYVLTENDGGLHQLERK